MPLAQRKFDATAPGLFTLVLLLSSCAGGAKVATTATVAPANQPPVITGTPPSTARTGTNYVFTPTASDPDGGKLSFSITGAPRWSSFNPASGVLSGTPQLLDIGTYGGIVISVTDGAATTSLAPFSVTVTAPPSTVTLSWSSPTTYSDGTPMTSIGGYILYYGNSAVQLNTSILIPDQTATSYVLSGLAPATYYFRISAYDKNGLEGLLSPVLSKVLP